MKRISERGIFKVQSTNGTVESKQRLRKRSFTIALATYSVVILATFLVTRLGLGVMTPAQWAIYVGLVVFGNVIFFVLYYSGANLRFADASLTLEQIIFASLICAVVLSFLPAARPIVLMFYLPAFSFGMLRLTLRRYLCVVACMMGLYALILCFEFFRNRQEFRIQYEIFLFALYGILLTWFAFFGGFVSNIRRHLRSQKVEVQKAHEEAKIEMDNRKRAEIEKDELIVDLKDALDKLKTLSGLLPICASCKKIRDDNGYWNQIEHYIQTHSDAEFSHGLCPTCVKKLYPDIDMDDENQ